VRTVSLQPLDLAIARAFGVMDDAVPSPDPGTPVVETIEINGDVGELILQVAAQALPSENSGTLTVEIETSPDNSTWTSVFSQEFTTSGSQTAAVAGDTYLRVTATPSGDTGRATVNVTATPSIIDKTSGGGSKPDGAVWVFTFPDSGSTDDAKGSNGDIALLLDTGTFIQKEAGTWATS
jgi:hypothetical protein